MIVSTPGAVHMRGRRGIDRDGLADFVLVAVTVAVMLVAMVIAMTVALADGCSPSLRRVLCRELEISAVGQERYGGGQ